MIDDAASHRAPASAQLARFRLGIVGHRPDRLPAANMPALRATIDQVVAAVERATAASSATQSGKSAPELEAITALAEGADRVFADAVAARAHGSRVWRLQAPLPFRRAEYALDFASEPRREFENYLARATAVFELDGVRDQDSGSAAAYENATRVVVGQSDLLIVVWDGERKNKRGGTETAIGLALQQRIPIVWIDAHDPANWALVPAGAHLRSSEKRQAPSGGTVAEIEMCVRSVPPAAAGRRDWHAHLLTQAFLASRGDFDMDDGPEAALLAQFPRLATALRSIDADLEKAYGDADRAARKAQRLHRLVSRVAVVGGVVSVACAVVQLAVRDAERDWGSVVENLEIASVLAAFFAVFFGFVAKLNHAWLRERHVAERLRMLKFQALSRPEYWAGRDEDLTAWVRARRDEVLAMQKIADVEEWARSETADPEEAPAPECALDTAEIAATAEYHCYKRVVTQGRYFMRQHRRALRDSHWLHRLSFPLFVLAMIMVAAHFFAEALAHHTEGLTKHALEVGGVVALTLAALVPVVGLGVRAWLGAFERVRVGHLFEAKGKSLFETARTMRNDAAKCAETMRHVARVEQFLANEHREWLRLLLAAEWFL